MIKPKSYLLIFFLALLLVFIIGVRYGQKVEQANKTIHYLLSITPTPTQTTPTPTPISYQEYKSRRWGLKFKYPANLQIKESINTAEIFFEIKEASNSGKN